MYILSNNEIKSTCLSIIANAQAFDLVMYDLFLNCYNIGARISEIRYFNNWYVNSSNQYVLQPLKGNLERTFNVNDITDLLRYSIDNRTLEYESCRYTTVTRYLSRFSPYPFLMAGNKQISTHIFRHNKYKQLYELLGSVSAVAAYFGEQSLSVAGNYINSSLYTP